MTVSKRDREDIVFELEPCLGCPHRARCRTGQACDAFATFVSFGGKRWTKEERVPNLETFRKIFGRTIEKEAA
jgi:hypothetical protein